MSRSSLNLIFYQTFLRQSLQSSAFCSSYRVLYALQQVRPLISCNFFQFLQVWWVPSPNCDFYFFILMFNKINVRAHSSWRGHWTDVTLTDPPYKLWGISLEQVNVWRIHSKHVWWRCLALNKMLWFEQHTFGILSLSCCTSYPVNIPHLNETECCESMSDMDSLLLCLTYCMWKGNSRAMSRPDSSKKSPGHMKQWLILSEKQWPVTEQYVSLQNAFTIIWFNFTLHRFESL